jgi:hypothetical protein
VRADAQGHEISIMPGLYRQTNEPYDFDIETDENPSLQQVLGLVEPKGSFNGAFPYDFMRIEQHYATQTAGLDITFGIESAIFFATHRFVRDSNGIATFEKVLKGEHQGVIYLFRFGSPPVRKSEYRIRDFDYFKTYPPVRILRQECGLPWFSGYERNIAVTDVDRVIELDTDFVAEGGLTPEYMFPNAKDDTFYGKLLDLKDKFPKNCSSVVEYAWARA